MSKGKTMLAVGRMCTDPERERNHALGTDGSCHTCAMSQPPPRNVPSPCMEEAFQIYASHQEGREADAGFDGGEFSGPAHDEMLHKALEELAGRYDVDVDQLWSAIHASEGMTSDEAIVYGDSQERPT